MSEFGTLHKLFFAEAADQDFQDFIVDTYYQSGLIGIVAVIRRSREILENFTRIKRDDFISP